MFWISHAGCTGVWTCRHISPRTHHGRRRKRPRSVLPVYITVVCILLILSLP